MSLDEQSCRENLVKYDYTAFGGAGVLSQQYFQYGRGNAFGPETTRVGVIGIEKGLIKIHNLVCFQATGLTLTSSIDINGVNVTASAIAIPTNIFVVIGIVDDIDYEINSPITLRGNLLYAGTPPVNRLFLYSASVIIDVKIL